MFHQHREKFLVIVQVIVFALFVQELVFFGVIEIALFFSSGVLVIGLDKLSTLGLEGNGAIFGSLSLKDEMLPLGYRKLVPLGSGVRGMIGYLERGGKS